MREVKALVSYSGGSPVTVTIDVNDYQVASFSVLNLDKVIDELTKIKASLPKPHPHAESMRLYALDAMETDCPWERWQISLNDPHCSWYNCRHHPDWNLKYVYRRKS